MVVFGQGCCNRVKWLNSGKSGCNQAKVVVIGQTACNREKWLNSCKSGCIWAKWLNLDKEVVFEKK